MKAEKLLNNLWFNALVNDLVSKTIGVTQGSISSKTFRVEIQGIREHFQTGIWLASSLPISQSAVTLGNHCWLKRLRHGLYQQTRLPLWWNVLLSVNPIHLFRHSCICCGQHLNISRASITLQHFKYSSLRYLSKIHLANLRKLTVL